MKPTIRILAASVLLLLLAANMTSCSPENAEEVAMVPISPLDARINSFEKTTNEYVRLSRKHTTGDVSITVLLIQARKSLQEEKATLQQAAPQMTPQQSEKVAAISAKADPYLPK